jgi:hypothetical protein
MLTMRGKLAVILVLLSALDTYANPVTDLSFLELGCYLLNLYNMFRIINTCILKV